MDSTTLFLMIPVGVIILGTLIPKPGRSAAERRALHAKLLSQATPQVDRND